MLVRGKNNIIYYRFYDLWSSAGVNNDQIWHTYINLTDNTFSGWTLLGGATPFKPTLTS